MTRNIFDISMPISEGMMVYKNKPEKKPGMQQVRTLEQGARESRISMDSHAGTHLDAPSHMLEDGKTIDKLDTFIHDAVVIDLTKADGAIKRGDLEGKDIGSGNFILLKTRNSFSESFDPDFVYLDRTGAEYLAGKDVTGVGIDALGIERGDPEHSTHKILFEAGIMVLEGLRLKHIREGKYMLIAAPLNIEGCDGSPVRALLIEK